MSEEALTMGDFEMLHSLYEFKASYAKTISFKANEFFILQQTNTKHKNWWEVINERGDVGYIPSNYVETVTVHPAFYLKFLHNAHENLMRRDSDDMVIGSKTDVMARLQELTRQVSQSPDGRASQRSNGDCKEPPVIADSCPAFTSSTVIEEPIRPITKSLDGVQKSIGDIHQEIRRIGDAKLKSDCRAEKCEPKKSDMSVSSANVTPVITAQSVYELVESVRINTNLSHEMSRIAVETVVQGLHELMPASIFPYLSTILSHSQSCLVVDDGQIEQTHDASRLKIIFNELTSCKEDSQQRSWMLHEDEAVIKEYITELISILTLLFVVRRRPHNTTMDLIKPGWFSEVSDLWPGQCFSLKVKEVLFHQRSQYQDVLIVDTTNHGRALILDGIIQCTQADEFSYQEMITFLPLCAHKNPQKVLIVGGGDGGVAREVAKHPSVQQFTQVEIDALVIEQSKKHLPFMAKGFESPKLTLVVGDGFDYMKNHQGEFDVIITDSSDPVGPAVNLFTESYFGLLKTALKPNGVICSQAGTVWTDLPHVKQTMKNCRKHFGVVKYAMSSVPTYPNGQIGYLVASLDPSLDPAQPHQEHLGPEERKKLRFYNPEVHRAAFVLPTCFQSELEAA